MLEIYRKPLPNWQFRIFPLDTRSIISAVFFGLGMTVALQIVERIDFALSGGTVFFVATMTVPQFENPAVFFYGLPGAILVAWINPIVANLTATSPLAPLFFTTNALHTIPLALLVWAFKPKDRGFKFWEFLILNQIAGMLDVLPLIWGALVVLEMPSGFGIFQYLIHQLGFLIGSFISFPILHRLLRSGLIETAEAVRRPRTV
jgi:hypothetical protein